MFGANYFGAPYPAQGYAGPYVVVITPPPVVEADQTYVVAEVPHGVKTFEHPIGETQTYEVDWRAFTAGSAIVSSQFEGLGVRLTYPTRASEQTYFTVDSAQTPPGRWGFVTNTIATADARLATVRMRIHMSGTAGFP